MRTTLTIDDLLVAVREIAARKGKTPGQVLSDLARETLSWSASLPAAGGDTEFFGFRPIPGNGVDVTNEIINRLRDGAAE